MSNNLINSITCEYCHAIIQKKSIVNHKTTRKCLDAQEKLGIKENEKLYECEYCNKTQTTKHSYQLHLKTCRNKIIKETEIKLNNSDNKIKTITETMKDKLEELTADFRNYKEETEYHFKLKDDKLKTFENEIVHLKKQIEEFSKSKKYDNHTKNSNNNTNSNNTNSNNTNSNNTTNHITIQTVMSPDKVEEFFKKNYNLDTLLEGQKGLARFVTEGFLKSTEETLYRCTDRSRQKFVMKQEDGSNKEDTNCEQLVQLTKPGLDHVSDVYETSLFERLPEDITESDIHDGYKNISDLGVNRSEFKGELSKIIPTETTPSDMSIWDRMKSKIQKEEKKEKYKDSYQVPIPKPDIGGISRGKLSIYRDRYKKDGMIKYPKALQDKLNQGDDSFQSEYLSFLQE